MALAKQHQRTIITFDQDFGEIYHFRESGKVGILVLRLKDQTVEAVNNYLERFFQSEGPTVDPDHSLVIVGAASPGRQRATLARALWWGTAMPLP